MSFHPNDVARRGRQVSIALVVAFGLLAVRAFTIQVLRHTEYATLAERNRLNEVPLPAPRAIIEDRNGEVIAENVPGYSVSILAHRDSARVVLERLARRIPLSPQQINATLRRHRQLPVRPALVMADAPFHIVSAIEEHRVEFPEVIIQSAPKRHYPDSAIVSAFVGYTSEVSEAELAERAALGYKPGQQIGKAGLEAQYEEALRGVEGSRFVEVDARGRIVRTAGVRTERPPTTPAPLRTNVDMRLQRHIAKVFGDSLQGAVVVMEPKTGAVLAMYSAPGYDPNEFIGGASQEFVDRLRTDPRRPWFNKAIQGTYPPGSTWKLATAIIALEEGVVRPDEIMPERCDGGYQYGRRRFRCWDRNGHGAVDMKRAVEVSCDVYFYQVGLRITMEKLIAGGRRLHFGEKTNVDLPSEYTSEFPPIDLVPYYNQRFPGGWSRGETLNLSIGQGANSTTVISMARFYTALATDGYMARPEVVAQAPERTRIFELSDEHLRVLRASLVGVIASGTATSAALKGITFAGKTGTSQNAHDALRDHAWFVGFAPAEEPEVVIAVMLEFGLSGGRAARIARNIVEYHLKASVISEPTVTGD